MSAVSERSVTELFSLSGKVAMVTGATGHLGRSIATALAEAGASVVVTSRRRDNAIAFAEQLPRVGGVLHVGIATDHMNEASIAEGFSAAISEAGKIDILIANGHEPLASDWRTVTADEFNGQLANATGYFLLSRLLRDHVVERCGRGSVVLLGSMYGVVGSYPDVYAGHGSASPAAYHALKGGIVQMARHLAVYWARDSVRVNCLSPGPFPSTSATPALVDQLNARCPMGRVGHPEELKGAAVFLSSDASSFMTGQNLLIDGGWTAW